LKSAVDRCKRKRRDLVDAWADNVDYLRGKPFDQESDEDRVYVNSDNVMSKRKATQLASQLPEARLTAKSDRVKPVLGAFAKLLNETLRTAKTGAALFETSKDVINAAGVGVVLCGYEARTEQTWAPAVDPMTLSPDQQAGLDAAQQLDAQQAAELLQAYQIPVMEVPRVTSSRFYVRRISPSDFLWPLEFERSDFDESPWLGHSDRMRWAEAKVAFKLHDDQKEAVLGAHTRAEETLRDATDSESLGEEDRVEYDQIFYWRAKYDPMEPHFDCIYRLVFVKGIDEPVIHDKWEGQQYLDGVGYVGATKLPIRVLTLDYVSDDAIPPSDSAIARPQVNEMIRSRTQMIQQRERSTPLRWHDVNRVDPLTSANMMRGTFQGSIPVKGNGNSIIGEVARASYPSENYEFDRIVRGDLTEAWGVDSNQLGSFNRGRRTAKEAEVVQANFATLMGFQRARVAAFFNGIAEVMAGLLVLHSNELPSPPPPPPPQPGVPPQHEAPLDVRTLSQQFDYSVLPDATVLLDANQRADQLLEVLDMVGKSGFVNPEPIIEEIVMLKGLDPGKVMRKPDPKVDDPNVSYRLSGVQDLLNPVVLAMLVEKGQAPSPESLQAAFKILQAARIPITPGLLMGLPPDQAAMMLPGMMAPPPPAGLPSGPTPRPELPPADARPEWTAMPTVSKRSDT